MTFRAKVTPAAISRARSNAALKLVSRVLATKTLTDFTGAFILLRVAERCSVNEYAPRAAPSRIAPAALAWWVGRAKITRFVPASERVAAPAARRSSSSG